MDRYRRVLLANRGRCLVVHLGCASITAVGLILTCIGSTFMICSVTGISFDVFDSSPWRSLYGFVLLGIGLWLIFNGVIGASHEVKSDGGLATSFHLTPYCLPILALTSHFAVRLLFDGSPEIARLNTTVLLQNGTGTLTFTQKDADFACFILYLADSTLPTMMPFAFFCTIFLAKFFDTELKRNEHGERVAVPEEKEFAVFCSRCSSVVEVLAGIILLVIVVHTIVTKPVGESSKAEAYFSCCVLLVSLASMVPSVIWHGQSTRTLFFAMLAATFSQYLCGIVLIKSILLKIDQPCGALPQYRHPTHLLVPLFSSTELQILRTVCALLFLICSTNSLLFRDILHAQKEPRNQNNTKGLQTSRTETPASGIHWIP